MYDLESATAVYRTRISADPIFLAAPALTSGGFTAINRCVWLGRGVGGRGRPDGVGGQLAAACTRQAGGAARCVVRRRPAPPLLCCPRSPRPRPLRPSCACSRGQVLLGTVNEEAMVPFVSQQLQNLDLAMALARRGNLPGAEGLIVQQFQRLYAGGQYKEAAELAAESPQGVLRTKETIESFKRVPAQPGQTSPLLVYFGTILTKSALNPLESVELGRLVIAQNKKQLLDNWWKVRGREGGTGGGGSSGGTLGQCWGGKLQRQLPRSLLPLRPAACIIKPLPSPQSLLPPLLLCLQDGKLAASEELGDLFKGVQDWDTAQAIYQQAGSSGKVVEALAAKGDFEQLVSR